MKKLLAILLVALLVCACFVGCSKNSGSSSGGIAGTYYPKTIDGVSVRDYYEKQAEDYGMDLGTFLTYSGMTEANLDKFEVLQLNADGTGSITTPQTIIDFNWTLDGETLTLSVDGSTETYPYKDGKITISAMGMTIVFGK